MTRRTQIKICGITETSALNAAIESGASFCGFVFHPASVRNLSVEQAVSLSNHAGNRIKKVGLFVDADNATLDSVTQRAGLDFIQLHGHEDARRVQMIRARTGLPIIKAIRVAGPEDLKDVDAFAQVADWLLFDAKVSGQAGGTGTAFDWTILSGRRFLKPWMLSGGLSADNIGTALSLLNPDAVDVSSGVENAPGIKSPDKIRTFVNAVQNN